jgi:DNA-directed RNA polymerase alpha subunit
VSPESDTPIEYLQPSQRLYNVLRRGQLRTVEQVLQLSEAELLALRGFDHTLLAELRARLGDFSGGERP